MKCKQMFTPPRKILGLLVLSASIVFSTSCAAAPEQQAADPASSTESAQIAEATQDAESESLAVISSGTLYDSVISLDPDLLLQESGTCLYVTRDISSSNTNDDIRRFFWDLLHVVQIYDVWDSYSNMSFTFMSGDNIANVGISGFSDLSSFNATHINVIQDQELSKLFEQFYADILGAHDLSIAQEKKLYEMAQEYGTPGYSLPTEYRAGYLWTISCFPYGTGYTVNDSSISVQVPTQDTKQCGSAAAKELYSAVDVFDLISNNDPLAMPYEKISIQYLDAQDSASLWDWCVEKKDGSWSSTKNSSGSPYFYSGIKSYSK